MTMQPSAVCIVHIVNRQRESGALGWGKGRRSSSRCVSLGSYTDVAERADRKAWGALYLWRHWGLDVMLRSLERLWVTVEVMPLRASRERSKTGGKEVREPWSMHKRVGEWTEQENWSWSVEGQETVELNSSSVFIKCNINPVIGILCINNSHHCRNTPINI